MKFKLLFTLLYIWQINAVLDPLEFHNQTKIPLQEIYEALNYLNKMEQGCDEDWGSYYHVMSNLIKRFDFKKAVEIGISFGSHCKYILENTNIQKLYGIDPYKNYGDPTNIQPSDNYFEIFFHKVKNKLEIYNNRFELIRDFSLKAATRFNNGEIDVAFLDANHTYEEVLKDLEAWWPKIKMGGILCGDDYATRHPGVPRAVNEFFSKKGINVFLDGPRYFNQSQPRIWIVFKSKE